MVMKLHVQKKGNFAQGHRQPLNLPSIYHYKKAIFLSVDTTAIKILIYPKCLAVKIC
jgi:hypothetical protein